MKHLILFLSCITVMISADSFSRDRDHHKDHHSWQKPHFPEYPSHRPSVRFLWNYHICHYNGVCYYYCDGLFYVHGPFGFSLCTPPSGMIMNFLPSGFQVVFHQGHEYRYYMGVYYLPVREGFMITGNPFFTPPPSSVSVPVQTADVPGTSVSVTSETEFTVNIPNSDGSFTPVKLTKHKEGFLGPQGEYYEEFPRVSQLKLMYGK